MLAKNRCMLAAWLVTTLVAAQSAVSQEPASRVAKADHRGATIGIPVIPQEVLQQLPPGCTANWNSFDTRSPGNAGATQSQQEMADAVLSAKTLRGKIVAAHRLAQAQPEQSAVLGTPHPRADAYRPHQVYPMPSPHRFASLSADDDDPLSDLGPAADRAQTLKQEASAESKKAPDPHVALWAEDCYPSAATCAKCHPKHYEEWRASSHSYSFVSPMFQVFEQTISDLSMGTVGYFCVRCHAPVATQMTQVERSVTVLDAPVVIREGITCIACHRVNEMYNKTNGHRRVETGDIHAPVYGGVGGEGVARVVADKDKYKVKLSPDDKGPGQAMHVEGRFFEPLSRSEFCMPCHQVAVHPGIALEVVWNQYRNAPARTKGITCQDCHMGHTPGKAYGYTHGPIAELGGKPFEISRKQSNHNFWGPSYSIAHPGLFPHNPKADRWAPRDWLAFDWRAGWGTESFERYVREQPGLHFPPPWDEADDRRDARKIINANLERSAEKRNSSIATLAAAVELDGPHVICQPQVNMPLEFKIHVRNESDGHNLPTASLGAQPQQWLNVAVIDPNGNRIFESGYLDSNGDLAEMMSEDVVKHRIAPDYQLFNLQTKFLITNVKGPDREFPLPVNYDIDQIPFLRPGAVPISVLNHPPFIRMEAHSVPPLGLRTASYKVPADRIKIPGVYRISARFRCRLEPPYFMRLCKATPEMIRRMNEQILDVEPQTTEVFVR
ncbi:MAG: multiheme c-type cytochrome [Pirellulaceae bacterium]